MIYNIQLLVSVARLLVQFLVVRRDVAKPNVAGKQDLLVPVLVEGDQVADVTVRYVRLQTLTETLMTRSLMG